jgi:hypothetical protein
MSAAATLVAELVVVAEEMVCPVEEAKKWSMAVEVEIATARAAVGSMTCPHLSAGWARQRCLCCR